MNGLQNLYFALGLHEKGFVFIYIMGFIFLIAGIFNIKPILLFMTMWNCWTRSYKVLRISAIIFGILLIITPIYCMNHN